MDHLYDDNYFGYDSIFLFTENKSQDKLSDEFAGQHNFDYVQ